MPDPNRRETRSRLRCCSAIARVCANGKLMLGDRSLPTRKLNRLKKRTVAPTCTVVLLGGGGSKKTRPATLGEWAGRAARSLSVPVSTTSRNPRRNPCPARSSRPRSSSTCNPCRRMCRSGSNRSTHTHRNRPVKRRWSRQPLGPRPSRPTE